MARPCNTLPLVIVEDEEAFRQSLAENLVDEGHRVVDYGLPAELPDLADLNDTAVLLTDYEMPGLDGLALADAFHEKHPTTPVILLSAYQNRNLAAHAEARAWLHFVSKPLDFDELHDLIHSVCGSECPGPSTVERGVAER